MTRTLLLAGVLILGGGLAFAQEDPNQTAANRLTHKSAPAATNATTTLLFPPAAICYTCGGGFRIFGGILPTAAAADELGPGCSGTFGTSFNDFSPYLCVR